MTRSFCSINRRFRSYIVTRRVVLWLAIVFTLVATVSSLVLGYLSRNVGLPPDVDNWPQHVLRLPTMIGAVALSVLIISRQPRNRYGWLWLLFGVTYVVRQAGETYAAYALLAQGQNEVAGVLPLGLEVAWLSDRAWFVYITTVPFLLVLFPNGRFPSRRWRITAWLIILSSLASALSSGFIPWPEGAAVGPFENPFVLVEGPLATSISDYWAVPLSVVFVSIVAAAVSVLRRLRRARSVERQQLKWFTLGASFTGVLMVVNISYASVLVLGEVPEFVPQWVWDLANQVAYVALFGGIAIAIMRYRLYDVDLVIRRTLVYGILTAALVSIYFTIILALQNALLVLTNRPQSEMTTVLSTLAIASLFNPLRTRIQAFIDRRFYRRKYDAQQTLILFGKTLRNAVELAVLTDDMLEIVRETLQPAHVSLWLRATTGRRRQDDHVDRVS